MADHGGIFQGHACCFVAGALLGATVLPLRPVAWWFGFEAPPLAITLGTVFPVTVYLVWAELVK